MAPTNKTNFKSYDSAIRLLAAVVATGKPKLDFKVSREEFLPQTPYPVLSYLAIALHMGEDFTGPSVDHRLRPIKRLAKMQERYVAENKNPGDLPVDEKEIQKLFGESTADGIEWQFRSIKKLGKAQQEAAKKGEDTSKVTIDGVGTPKTNRTLAGTPGGRKRFATAVTTPTTTGKRARIKKVDDDLDDDVDGEEIVEANTPTHKKPRFTDSAADQVAPSPAANASPFVNGQQPVSLFGNGQAQVTAGPVSFTAASLPGPTLANDDDLVEIDSSQFSQSSAKSKLDAATRHKHMKQEPAGADVSSSFADIPHSQSLESSHHVATSFYNPHSFGPVPAHDNSVFSNQNHEDLSEDEV
ncbi:hypothetical protein PG994_014914 [Apiospora phragmitis]|uniref:Uncharacterized protein n=1 Tax=Apiospora phragmitis TaxID=2905665 RepID=A0ABR1SUZ4_9PEZI